MIFHTTKQWDEELWTKARVVYQQAFGTYGVKSDEVIRNMFRKNLCSLHVVLHNHIVIAMALTGKVKGGDMLLIDYIAVHDDYRNQQIGQKLVNYIEKLHPNIKQLLIEVEAKPTPENELRVRFWKKCGFHLLDDIHQYKWIPEPYRAMVKTVRSLRKPRHEQSGREMFTYITAFHRLSFKGK